MPNVNFMPLIILIGIIAMLYPAWHVIRRSYRRFFLLHTGMDTDLDMDDWNEFYKREKHCLLPKHVLEMALEAAEIEGYSENFNTLLDLVQQRFGSKIQIGHLIWIWEMVRLGDEAVRLIEALDVPDFNDKDSV